MAPAVHALKILRITLAVPLLASLVCGCGPGKPLPTDAVQDSSPITVEARRGDFRLHVVESGVLDARRSITLASDLPSNRGKIIQMAPEGSFVREGDIVVKFDPAPFEDDVTGLKNELDEAVGALAQAEQELQLDVSKANAEKQAREHQIRVAELELENLREADLPLRLAKARNDLKAAEQAYRRSKREAENLRDLFAQGFGKQQDIDESRAAMEEARASYEYLKRNYELLEKQVAPAELRKAELELDKLRGSATDQTRIAQHRIALKNAALMRVKARVEKLRKQLDDARKLLDETVIRAPVSGFVVLKRISVQGETRKVQIGDSVWYGNGFITIPDMSAIIASIQVRETEIGQIREGQPVRIRPQAYPTLELTGKVETVGTLANGKSGQSPRFSVRIVLDNVDERLRPGMTARVTIDTGHFRNAVRIPVEAVFFDGDQTICYQHTAFGPRRVAVTLGQSDGSMVVVEQGLSGGERLLLYAPEDISDRV